MSPFELMYGIPPRMDPRPEIFASVVIPSADIHRRLELLAGYVPRAIRAGASNEKRIAVASSYFFRQGEKVLVARGTAFCGTKWPANVLELLRTEKNSRSPTTSIRLRFASQEDIKETNLCWQNRTVSCKRK